MLSEKKWEEIERDLSFPYKRRDLIIDGHMITLQVQRIKGLQYGIMVFIDGELKGKHITGDIPGREKFFCAQKRCFCDKKTYNATRRVFGKKEAEAQRDRMTIIHYVPWWTCFSTMKRHFKKHCNDIKTAV